MADDIQKDVPPADSADTLSMDEETRPRRKKQPRHPDFPKTQAGKLWEAFGNPEEPINEMPGGTYNTAGGRPRDITWRDTLSVNLNEYGKLYQKPCVRDSLLVGLAGGFGVGSLRAVLGGKHSNWHEYQDLRLKICTGIKTLMWSSNLAVLTFSAVSSGMYFWCERRRVAEAQGMAEAVAMMKKLQQKKQEEEAAERLAKEKQRLEEEQRKSWKSWKSW